MDQDKSILSSLLNTIEDLQRLETVEVRENHEAFDSHKKPLPGSIVGIVMRQVCSLNFNTVEVSLEASATMETLRRIKIEVPKYINLRNFNLRSRFS
jgi:hypothetical protein